MVSADLIMTSSLIMMNAILYVLTSGFPVHKIILGADKYIIENIANLEKMPAIGAYVLTLPIKGSGLTEAPVRMVGDKGMNNGLTNCWLSSSLAISAKEQIHFLNKLVTNTLPVSLDAQEKTKNILYQETLPSGWELYGKTGNGSQLDADGNKIKDRQVGWFVGFVRKDETIITFVQLISDDAKQDTYASLRAKAVLKDHISNVLSGFIKISEH